MDPNMALIARSTLVVSLMVTFSVPAMAGTLTVTWPAATDDLTVGYRVFVGTEPGVYGRELDVGVMSRVTIEDLEDERVYYLAVKGYDANGQESPTFSPELVSLPRPRIEQIGPPSLMPGDAAFVTLRGANFDPQVQVRVVDSRVSLRSAVSTEPGALVLLLEASPATDGEEAEPIVLEAEDFTLINPGRKAPEYFETHPETVDIDADGWIGNSDLALVRNALGTRPGDELYRSTVDLNGDGQVDTQDLGRVLGRLGTEATYRNETQEGLAGQGTTKSPIGGDGREEGEEISH